MPLNIGTGNSKPYAKYNAKADKWFAPADQEISRPTFVADFDNIRTGWFRFLEGQAPERIIEPSPDQAAPRPSQNHKRGFVMMVYSQQFFGGAVEFSSASMHLVGAIAEVYDAWEQQQDRHPGELPVVACTGSQTMRDRYGTNYRPTFAITKWAPRPADLPDESPVDPADVWQGDLLTPATTPRPAATPAARPALDTQPEF